MTPGPVPRNCKPPNSESEKHFGCVKVMSDGKDYGVGAIIGLDRGVGDGSVESAEIIVTDRQVRGLGRMRA